VNGIDVPYKTQIIATRTDAEDADKNCDSRQKFSFY
jgi:hypothetical protein